MKKYMKHGLWIGMLLVVMQSGMVQPAAAEENVVSKFGGTLYGYARLDIAYDTAWLYPGNYVLYANAPGEEGLKDNELNITASSSRLGYKYAGSGGDDLNVNGGIEVDFFGGGKENAANIRMRLAFMEMVLPKCGLQIMAGQHWDLLMVQHPGSYDDGISWYAGNLGYRRPQLRVSKTLSLAEKTDLVLKAALTRNIGDAIAASPGDTGEDDAMPAAQMLVQYKSPLFMAALSGHYGQEEYDVAADDTHTLYQTYSVRADLSVPFGSIACLKVCAWKGTNMDAYMGGIGQGINTAKKESIASRGGFVAVQAGIFNIGGSIDVPDYEQIAVGAKQQNSKVFVDAVFKLNPGVELGLELAQWRTLYKETLDGEALRAHAMIKSSF